MTVGRLKNMAINRQQMKILIHFQSRRLAMSRRQAHGGRRAERQRRQGQVSLREHAT